MRPAGVPHLGGGPLPAFRPWFARGRGEPQEDRRYQLLALAAGFSEMGSFARRTLRTLCEGSVNRFLTDIKRAARQACSWCTGLVRFRNVLTLRTERLRRWKAGRPPRPPELRRPASFPSAKTLGPERQNV